ncbi:pantoate--beta-alanine ligase [Agromyces archimandritae]|uniref:Pantothenate synthetase n=1 Tax=Agromyces archimandritae TaxID=2781962 RepID=A0A975FPZ7_9MICO|nr:pantoate--beta-alanine ligase [Agromyces archimandritae]QTX05563.1 pantoate--beta-alanine ligase [Agromyces archimandritae]
MDAGAAPAVLTTIAETRTRIAAFRRERPGASIALVPTMGALHDGHLALVREAKRLADRVVVSIFVNPLQFGAGEDLGRYPRTLDADVALLAAEGVDLVFAPNAAEMYPDGSAGTTVHAGPIGDRYEGAARPGHFDGVLTVVEKLLGIASPDIAVFGQKDAQQLHLVGRMVADLDLPVEIVSVPIVRERDGLALSSRNRYLSPEARRAALALAESLQAATRAAGGGVDELLAEGIAAFGDHDDVELDYFVAVDPETFLPVDDGFRGQALVLVAALVDGTRLIDNTTMSIG